MNKAGLAAAVFLSSASVMVLEIAAARLLAPYVGMSIYTWTCIIATILAGMSLGHWFGGHLSEAESTRVNRYLAILFGAASFSVILVPFVLRIAAPKLLVDGAPFLASISVLTALLFFLPSILIACVTPMITKIAIDAEPNARGGPWPHVRLGCAGKYSSGPSPQVSYSYPGLELPVQYKASQQRWRLWGSRLQAQHGTSQQPASF